jgi:response regulator NasT
MEESHRILVAHHDTERGNELSQLLTSLGHDVAGHVSTRADVMATCRGTRPDLILSSLRLEDGDAIRSLIDISRIDPLPSIIVTPRSDLASVERALEDHVMAYLVEPVVEEDLRPTIKLVLARFEQFRELQAEVQDLKSALTARKTIEKAKGVLMKQHGLDESEAFRMLQKTAASKRRKLLDIADAILLARDLEAPLDAKPNEG